MELAGNGNWTTLQFLRGKHQLFITSLDGYNPAARTRFGKVKDIPREAKMLLHLSGKEWDDAVEALKEVSERQAIMHLFTCFERIIRVDGQIRGEQPTSHHHAFFVKASSLAPSFVRFDQWLQCWNKVAGAAKHRSAGKEMRLLKLQFTDERNPLMHSDQAIIPPFWLVAPKLRSSLATVQHLASDFPLQR
jgi:hypothetical protein